MRRTLFTNLFLLALASCGYNQSELPDLFIRKLQRTDRLGQVVFDAGPITVKDRKGRPLPGITVMYLLNTETSGFMVTTIDSRQEKEREFYPQTLEGKLVYDSSTEGERKSSLLPETSIFLSTIKNFIPLYEEATNGPGVFMRSDGNVDVYCVPKEEILRTQVDIPVGIVTMGNRSLKIGLTTRVRSTFEYFVFGRGKQYEAYEVRTPRRAVNLCGPDYGNNTICTLDSNRLSRQLWQPDGVPVWSVGGPCNVNYVSSRKGSRKG